MTMRDAEIEVQKLITETLIDYDHQDISIIRPAKRVLQADRSLAPQQGESERTLPPQKLFLSGVTADDVRMVTVNGELVESRFVLIGMADGENRADFEEGDTFVCWGRNFLIADVHPDMRWQRKAWLVERPK